MTVALTPTRVRVLAAGGDDAEYALDVDAIRRACEHLKLTRPVEIAYRRGHRWNGVYRPTNGAHRITVHAHADAESASRTLWHELEHARQEERGERDPRGTLSLRGDAYRSHPNEVAARRRESMHATHPLAHPL